MGRTRGARLARPELDHSERNALSGCGSQPRRRLRKYAELDGAGQAQPSLVLPVEVQVDLDTERFYKMFVDLLTHADTEAVWTLLLQLFQNLLGLRMIGMLLQQIE